MKSLDLLFPILSIANVLILCMLFPNTYPVHCHISHPNSQNKNCKGENRQKGTSERNDKTKIGNAKAAPKTPNKTGPI